MLSLNAQLVVLSTSSIDFIVSTIRNMKISCPPVIVQKRIVEIIDTLDKFVIKSEFAITEGRNLRSGLLSNLLSGEHDIPASYDKVIGAA